MARERVVKVRLSDRELERLREAAGHEALAPFIRRMVDDAIVRQASAPPPEPETATSPDLLAQLDQLLDRSGA
jgi:hypothetical protein